MKQLLLSCARGAFAALPLSPEQREQIKEMIFRLTGDRLKHLPSYQLYKRNLEWRRTIVAGNLQASRREILAEGFGSGAGRAMLMVSHTLGGGTQQHVDDISARLRNEGWRIFNLERHNENHLRLTFKGAANPLFFRWPDDWQALAEALRLLKIEHLHLHHTVDLPEDFLPRFYDIARFLNVAYDFTVHDYFSICPRFTLYDEAVRGYCGEPEDVRKCIACVKRFGSHVGRDIDVGNWREKYGYMLAQARKVFVPDADIAIRLQRYFPQTVFNVMPHPEKHFFTPLSAKRIGGPLKVVIIGGIAPHKGSHVIYDCAEDALKRGLPIEFHLVGYSDIDHKLGRLKNVRISGHFNLGELPGLLAAGGYHLAFLPSIWPETYNYVLSECWRFGLFTLGMDIGAIASRIKAAPGLGAVLPLEWYLYPGKINDALLAQDIATLKEKTVFAQLTDYQSMTTEYYQL